MKEEGKEDLQRIELRVGGGAEGEREKVARKESEGRREGRLTADGVNIALKLKSNICGHGFEDWQD